MNKYEFLTQLEEQLLGFVSNQEVRESVFYYQSYIEEEIRSGRTEEEVLEDLGSANSIAKAIIEARGHATDTDRIYDETGRAEDREYDSYSNDDPNPYAGGYEGRNGAGSNVKVFRTDGWKGTAVLIGILLILVLLLVFAFRILAMLLPFIIPFALILFLIKMVTGRR